MDRDLEQLRLRAKLVRTRGRLTRLAAFRAFAIPVGLLIILFGLIATGIPGQIGPGFRWIMLWLFTGLILVTLFRGFGQFRKPTVEETRAALDATDPHRPISAMSDHPAVYHEQTQAYWNAHKAQLHARIQALALPTLSEDWRKADPLYLRFLAPVLLVLAFALNWSALPARFSNAGQTDMGALFGADRLDVSAWLTPPDYTGKAPVFLASAGENVAVPAGSKLTFRVHGPGQPVLKRRPLEKGDKLEGDRTVRPQKILDGAYQVEIPVQTSQVITLHYWGERGSWTINTAPDQPPSVIFVTGPAPDEQDKLTFRWRAEDDYGLSAMSLLISTTEDSGVPPGQTDRVALDLPTLSPLAEANARLDLTRHKWSGLPVRLSIEAMDSAGQTAVSDSMVYILPEKLFLEPMAKASQEIRLEVLREDQPYTALPLETVENGVFEGLGDRLGAAPVRVQRAALMLDAITYRPDIFSEDMTVYLGLKRAFENIRGARTTEELAPLDNLLWAVSMRAEYGTLADAARRLEAARRALERALREGADEDEIRRLMQAFREAAEDYIAARMADAIMNGDQGGEAGEGGGNMLGGQDLEDMLAALEDLAETGATDAARQLLDDVSQLLNNLNFQAGNGSGDGMPFGEGEPGDEEERSPEEQALQGALDKLSELMEEQRRLNDDTVQERNGAGDPYSDQPPSVTENPGATDTLPDGTEPGEQGEGDRADEERSLAERQSGILEDLQAFADEMGNDEGAGSGLTADEFEQAERALDRAANALERGDLDAAQWNQDRAIQELRDAASELAESLDERRSARRGEDGQETNNESDPLGRPAGGSQNPDSDGVKVPEEAERQRARDILDDLRDRLNKSTDPEEREYLKRLLDRFGS